MVGDAEATGGRAAAIPAAESTGTASSVGRAHLVGSYVCGSLRCLAGGRRPCFVVRSGGRVLLARLRRDKQRRVEDGADL